MPVEFFEWEAEGNTKHVGVPPYRLLHSNYLAIDVQPKGPFVCVCVCVCVFKETFSFLLHTN